MHVGNHNSNPMMVELFSILWTNNQSLFCHFRYKNSKMNNQFSRITKKLSGNLDSELQYIPNGRVFLKESFIHFLELLYY